MKVEFSHGFIKIFKKRLAGKVSVQKRFEERLRLFSADPTIPILKDHQLSGKLKGFRAFSLTGDIRVVYYLYNNIAYFVDIGTHNQVYGK